MNTVETARTLLAKESAKLRRAVGKPITLDEWINGDYPPSKYHGFTVGDKGKIVYWYCTPQVRSVTYRLDAIDSTGVIVSRRYGVPRDAKIFPVASELIEDKGSKQ